MSEAPPSIAPVQRHQRIPGLDTLRGVAMLGIIYANTPSFAFTSQLADVPYPAGDGPAERAALLIHEALIDFKLMSCFALLFGIGMALQLQRADARGATTGETVTFFIWRYALLAAIGLVHGVGLWYGDILLLYAICALAALTLSRLPPGLQFGLGVGGVTICALLWFGMAATFDGPPQTWTQVSALSQPGSLATQITETHPGGAAEVMIRGPWSARFLQNLIVWLTMLALMIIYGWRIVGLFLIGMSLARGGWLAPDSPRRKARLIGGLACLSVGLAAEALRASAVAAGPQTIAAQLWEMGWQQFSATVLALGYLALALSLPTSWSESGWLAGLNRAGRMALTLYILETLVNKALFEPWGLGLSGELSRADIGLLSLALAGLFASGALIWMRAFRYGPLEWAWRSAAYLRWQPLWRRAGA